MLDSFALAEHIDAQVSVQPPGSNRWVGNPLPTTMIGSEMWHAVHSTVKVKFDKPAWASYNSSLVSVPATNVSFTGENTSAPHSIDIAKL